MRRHFLGALAAVGLLGSAGCSDGSAQHAAAPSSQPSTTAAEAQATSTPACDAPCYAEITNVGSLPSDVVVEVSGMAASRLTPGVYYVVSDEPGTSAVAAVREDGGLIARVDVEGMSAENAEALAVGPCGTPTAETCLYVGDIGDHVGRDDVVVYRVPEPDLSEPARTAPAVALRYTYPDEPADAEALVVDDRGRPLIVTKAVFDATSRTTGPTSLFRGDAGGGVLEDLGVVPVPEPARAVFATLVGNVVTDASAAEGRVLLRTYDEVLEFRADGDGPDLAGFADWPLRRVPAPSQIQSETVTYRAGGCGYLTTSELTGSIEAVGCA